MTQRANNKIYSYTAIIRPLVTYFRNDDLTREIHNLKDDLTCELTWLDFSIHWWRLMHNSCFLNSWCSMNITSNLLSLQQVASTYSSQNNSQGKITVYKQNSAAIDTVCICPSFSCLNEPGTFRFGVFEIKTKSDTMCFETETGAAETGTVKKPLYCKVKNHKCNSHLLHTYKLILCLSHSCYI